MGLRSLPHAIGLAGATAFLAGCSPERSAVLPGGFGARGILDLIELFTAVCVVVWLLVMIALAIACLRRRSGSPGMEPLRLWPPGERSARLIVSIATAATVITITVLTLLSFLTGKGLADIASDSALRVRLTGHQWWWEVRYENENPANALTTANEIHVPVGVPVTIELRSTDVIHSFWIPSLAGKQDLIPGRNNEITIVAERLGTYAGQCAEFCGLQHAHMGLLVIAQPQKDFDAWYALQLRPAPQPVSTTAARGKDIFLSGACSRCHTVRGTPAIGSRGPDLTHIAARRYIAAGTLPMDMANMTAWVQDPQMVKPGNRMPRVPLTNDQLDQVVSYVGQLK